MTGIGMAGLAWLGHERVGDSHTSVCADELVMALREMMAGQMANQAAMLGAMRSGFAAKEKAAEPSYNWLITYAGVDMAAYIEAAINAVWPECEEKGMVVSLAKAATTFMLRADKDRDRTAAGADFVKKVKKATRGLTEEAVETLLEAVEPLTNPHYVKNRGLDGAKEAGAGGGAGQPKYNRYGRPYSVPTAAQPAAVAAAPTAYAGPTVYATPTTYAPPAGFQLVPCAQPTATPPPVGAGGGAAARPRVGKASLDPTKTYPPAHFARPCMYCAYPAHSGDGCWKTFPELRTLNL